MTITQKRYLISSLITFSTGFIVSIAILMNSLTVENVGWSVILGILLAGLRGGIKAVAEYLVSSQSK